MSAPKLSTIEQSDLPLAETTGALPSSSSIPTKKIPRRSNKDEKPKHPVTIEIEDNEKRVLSMIGLVNESRSLIYPSNFLTPEKQDANQKQRGNTQNISVERLVDYSFDRNNSGSPYRD